jgi:hypothetical protein
MRRRRVTILESVVTFAFALALPACGARVTVHDEMKAARVAEKFARAAFVARDFPTAHGFMSKEAQEQIPLSTLTEAAAKMHAAGLPTSVKATDFEPISGQRAMNILLVGQNGSESFYYRLVMVGDSGSGYSVASVSRGNGPYPGNKRPLPSPVTDEPTPVR